MSGLLSKAWSGLDEGLVGKLVCHVTEHAGVSRDTAKLGLSVVAATTTSLMLWKLVFAGPRNLPPGPRPLPVIGNLMDLKTSPRLHESIHALQKKYGELMTFYLGPQRVISIASHELLREAFVRQTEVTSDRPYMLAMEIFSDNGEDIVQANNCPRMQMQRKLAHQALRKFSGGGGLSKYVHVAFDAMCGKLDEDPRLDGKDMGFLISYNILLSMCFGKSFSFDDEFFVEMVALTKEGDELFKEFSVLDMMPGAQYLPLSKVNKLLLDMRIKFCSYIEASLEEHKKNFNKDELSDFTDHLLNVMNEAENDPNERSAMKLLTHNNYVLMLMDLFSAGTDTTRMTLDWIWHYLAAYPDVQKRAQEEVDDVLGQAGEVTAACRDKLPYVDAVLHEIMRIQTVAPIGLFHEVSTDIKLGGYDIPKGSSLMSNTYSIHLDPKYWKDPEAFLPERWLDESGKYQYQQTGFVPFSMGRRSCIGESFVKMELLMLTTLMLQRYTLEPTPGYTVCLDPIDSMIVQPVPQQPLIAKRRA